MISTSPKGKIIVTPQWMVTNMGGVGKKDSYVPPSSRSGFCSRTA